MQSIERRTDAYVFEKRRSLELFFSQWIKLDDIQNTMTRAKRDFKIRKDCGLRKTKLQYLNKCQFKLLEQLSDKITTIIPTSMSSRN